MARQNVGDLDDLPKLVPGLTLNYGTQPGNFSINLSQPITVNSLSIQENLANSPIAISGNPLTRSNKAIRQPPPFGRVGRT